MTRKRVESSFNSPKSLPVFTHRPATFVDVPEISSLIEIAIAELQKPFLSGEQIASSRSIMGLDTQLIADGTYFVVMSEDSIVGCGGWSFRATAYGSDATSGRSAARLNPDVEAARIRAMYTHPDRARQGIGRLVLKLCEAAARSAGFREAELVATMSGYPLYLAGGFLPIEAFEDRRGGTGVPLIRMRKPL